MRLFVSVNFFKMNLYHYFLALLLSPTTTQLVYILCQECHISNRPILPPTMFVDTAAMIKTEMCHVYLAHACTVREFVLHTGRDVLNKCLRAQCLE